MEQINEFSQFHALSPALRNNVQKYVDFSFAVTNGLNVESIGAGACTLKNGGRRATYGLCTLQPTLRATHNLMSLRLTL